MVEIVRANGNNPRGTSPTTTTLSTCTFSDDASLSPSDPNRDKLGASLYS
ncbi:hypothetical protein JIR001_23330 [Polycladomyces abyssicola]|uniref:Uncharacterized protein n=1 Tax=Polycladomyces abyssicola TaxID=1125966 RepID=A0A8D5UG11_9BACL|nr:hypothetical protein JIR001_23330 [Polycladomyces abyssicola]